VEDWFCIVYNRAEIFFNKSTASLRLILCYFGEELWVMSVIFQINLSHRMSREVITTLFLE
jgi:hypothetical protein